MRILIVDDFYGGVIDWIYGQEPGLGQSSYARQLTQIKLALFGETWFEVDALRALGHEAQDGLVNVRPLQAAWALRTTCPCDRNRRWGLGRRRRWVPWPRRRDSRWMGQLLVAQVAAFKPDVVHIRLDGLAASRCRRGSP